MFFLLLLILPGVRTQDPTLPSYAHRSQQLSFNTVQFLQHKPAKKGPILFPNDAPPPPPTPLIVTSRPLSESIARSELNPNNSLAAQSQYHQVTFKPNYLARGKNYEPYSYTLATVTPAYDYNAYADTARMTPTSKENLYEDHEDGIDVFCTNADTVRKQKLPYCVEPSSSSCETIARPLIFKYKMQFGIVVKFKQPEKKPMRRKGKGIQVLDTFAYSAQVHRINKHSNDYDIDFNDDDNNFDFDFIKLFLHDVKPLYKFNNIQRQHNSVPEVDHYKYKDPTVQFYRGKINVDEHDYNKENNHGDNYAFSYTVKDHKTGDDFSHSQKSTGSATNGEYRVRLPDGRMQIVSYTADENGYKADVRYDDQDNSIDFDTDKDKGYLNNNVRGTYNQNFANTYLHRPQQNLQQIPTSYNSNPPSNYKQFEDLHNYETDNDNLQYQPTLKPVPNNGYQFVYPTKSVYIDTTRPNTNDRTADSLSNNNDDYLEHYNSKLESQDKVERAHNDYKFSDELDFTKEEMLDYSTEIDQAYQPHKSKFSAFANNQNVQANVRPSYNELKDLFVTNVNGRRNAAIEAVPVVSTVRPVYAVTPESVVAITPKKPNLYTSIKNIASATPAPFLFSTPSPSTPRSYLLSTIANLKHQINLANKPVLSDHYINKINKYLTYTNPSKVDA